MSWIYLGIAVIFEITVALAASKAQSLTPPRRASPTLASAAGAPYSLCPAWLTFAVGVGYALWVSVAGVGITILGALLFSQRLNWRQGAGIGIVLIGVIGLQLAGAA